MDPYKVLGVSPSATDEEVKQAYRALAKKYHPDNYVNNPIADLAAEKMKEINTAYDTIMQIRSGAASGGADPAHTGYRSTASSPQYATIRSYISSGNLDAADALLEQNESRDAEWLFLKGSVCYRRGWLDQARQYFQQAASMDPDNLEYASANERLGRARGVYRERGAAAGGASACDCCSSLICADCCCECMGGDLVPCC